MMTPRKRACCGRAEPHASTTRWVHAKSGFRWPRTVPTGRKWSGRLFAFSSENPHFSVQERGFPRLSTTNSIPPPPVFGELCHVVTPRDLSCLTRLFGNDLESLRAQCLAPARATSRLLGTKSCESICESSGTIRGSSGTSSALLLNNARTRTMTQRTMLIPQPPEPEIESERR